MIVNPAVKIQAGAFLPLRQIHRNGVTYFLLRIMVNLSCKNRLCLYVLIRAVLLAAVRNIRYQR